MATNVMRWGVCYTDEGAHVWPLFQNNHNLDGLECWCGPEIQECCPECDEGDATCWRCGGERWREAGTDPEGPVIVVHNVHRPQPEGRPVA